MKKCCHCKKRRLESEFVVSKRTRDKLTNDCKRCRKIWCDRWREENPEKVKQNSRNWYNDPSTRKIRLKNKRAYRQRHPERVRAQVRAAWKKNKQKYAVKKFESWLSKTYGLAVAEYQDFVRIQNGVCAICRREQLCNDKTKFRGRLFVDHCHTTGKVRGLLCFKCNVLLGCANDDGQILLRAAEYLHVSKAK